MKDLYGILDSRYQNMYMEFGTIKSHLAEFRKEMLSIKTIYGNEEIRSLLKRSEDARNELDSIKFEVESILPELKSVLSGLKIKQEDAPTNQSTKLRTLAKTEYEETEFNTRPDLESIRISYDKEIKTIAARYEETRTLLERLNSEYASKAEEVYAINSEIISLKTQKDLMLRELDKAKSELESAKLSNSSNEIQLILQEIDNTRLELSDVREEKRRLEDELDDTNSKIKSARSELEKILVEIDDAKSNLELKNHDISTARRELEFIEKELALVHEKDEIRKLTKASAKLVEDANKRYMEAEKELYTLRSILAKKIPQPESKTNSEGLV